MGLKLGLWVEPEMVNKDSLKFSRSALASA